MTLRDIKVAAGYVVLQAGYARNAQTHVTARARGTAEIAWGACTDPETEAWDAGRDVGAGEAA